MICIVEKTSILAFYPESGNIGDFSAKAGNKLIHPKKNYI